MSTEPATECKIVSVSKTTFKSIPLFLPNNAIYDPKTNTVKSKTKCLSCASKAFSSCRGVDKPISCVVAVGSYRTENAC